MDLSVPISSAGFLFKRYSKRLEKLGIFTLADLLYHIPRKYEDLSLVSSISQVKIGDITTIQGTVESATIIRTKRGLSIQKVAIQDNTGKLDITFFNQPYIMNVFKPGKNFSISGKIGFFNKKIVLQPKSYEEILDIAQDLKHTGKLISVYPETSGITSKWFRNRIDDLLQNLEAFPDPLPPQILSTENLPTLLEAFKLVHLPHVLEDADQGKKRLAFDELFMTHLKVLKRKEQLQKEKGAVKILKKGVENALNQLITSLPFELTPSQIQAFEDITNDISKTTPMNRMLEGDVGSGKTIVATLTAYLAFKKGYQTILMAPTEILASQHYNTISEVLKPFDLKISLVTSSTKKTSGLTEDTDIAIGTHALLHTKVNFPNLALVIIDEQQRFGVEQRAKLRQMSKNAPHVLTMTATPIPRSIALTIYGDLALSHLKELPKGRITVKTWLVPQEKRSKGYEWIIEKMKEREKNGTAANQVFVVCPFIEISENLDTVKAAKDEYERLKNEIFSGFEVALLHGKMTQKEKDAVLDDFKEGKIDVLVSTPVVEVGIDIPNATIMIIEGAERFGLSQLHQLRGRVGRREKESFCFLFSSNDSEQINTRLKYLETIHVGSELAEIDLALRGPGQIYGTLQHGSPELTIASFSDRELIETSRKYADEIYQRLSSFPDLQSVLESTIIHSISPD